MSLVFLDRIKETTATTGTGALTLAGALADFRAFSLIGNGNTCYYTIDDGASNWEVGLGTYSSSGNTLARTSVLSSSNGNAAVNFGSGSKNVWLDVPSAFLSSIPNSNLANSSITLNTHPVSLGGSLTLSKSDIGLGNVENTALSTWAGSTNITTLGTIATGSIPYSLITGGPSAFDTTANYTVTGVWTFAPTARSSGVAPYWSLRTPADTGLTLNSEAIGAQFGGSSSQATVTRTFADGTVAVQRENAIVAPTYAGTTVTGVSFTSCTTLDISGGPVAGSHASMPQNGNLLSNYALTVGLAAGSGLPAFSVDGAGFITSRNGQLYIYSTANGGTLANPIDYCAISPTPADHGNLMGLFGTMPTVVTAAYQAFIINVTGAGSSAPGAIGVASLVNTLKAGYTGSAATICTSSVNQSAGTASSFTEFGNNCGAKGYCGGTTTGTNIGTFGLALNGALNYAVQGQAVTNKNSGTNIGVAGYALNAGTSPTQVAGYFGLQNAVPTFTSAALIADNGGTSSPVFLARVNGTTEFTIDSSGNVQLQTISSGTWNGTIIGTAYGGTGVDNSTGGTANQFWARPNGATGAATYRAIVAADVPTLNQNTTGSAATLTTARTLWGQSFDGSANISGSLTAVGNITGGASSMTIVAGTGNSRTITFQTTTSGGTATTALTLNADQSATFANTVNATTFVGALTGNASTATTLQTGRAINGVTFDGSAPITVTAAAGTLTGTTLNSTVVTSSLTSVGTLGSLAVTLSDSGTNTAATVVTIGHDTSGTAAAGFGSVTLFNLQDSTTADTNAANITTTWATATHASRKARVVLNVYDTASREGLRIEASGTAPMIGFLGASASAALASPDLGTLATTFGLATGTPTFGAANLTGTTLASSVVTTSITSTGTLSSLTVTGLTTTNGGIKNTKRVTTVSDPGGTTSTTTPNTDNCDITYENTTQSGTLTIANDTGTPTNGQAWLLEIKATNAISLSFGTVYVGGTVALPTALTGSSKTDYFSFLYDTGAAKWRFTGSALGF